MNEKLRVSALAVFSKEDYQNFARALFKNNHEEALELAGAYYDDAVERVLATVYNDECDFVLMSHYRQTRDLLTLVTNMEDEDEEVSND